MGWDLAVFVTWGAFLVDGNPLTNLLSIGQQSAKTGSELPAPAIVGGLNTHGVFEGDSSLTLHEHFLTNEIQVMQALPEEISFSETTSISTKPFSTW